MTDVYRPPHQLQNMEAAATSSGSGGFSAEAFTVDVGRNILASWLPIAERHRHEAYSEQQRDWQLLRRGRYLVSLRVEGKARWERGKQGRVVKGSGREERGREGMELGERRSRAEIGLAADAWVCEGLDEAPAGLLEAVAMEGIKGIVLQFIA